LPPQVRQALTRDVIDHRSAEFEALLREATSRLKQFYQTTGDVLVLTASGTGGLEAALVNVLSPGDRVLAVSVGAFGERFAAIARAFGAEVIPLDFPWGQPLDPAAVARALREHPDVRLLLTTHNETSTGVLNPLEGVAEALRGLGSARPLWLVDAVSSLGAVDLPVQRWGCDVVISASQKAWMAPPGLAFVGMSARAWEWAARARCPRYYWDLRKAREHAQKGQTPFTPAVTALYGLREALRSMSAEGLPALVQRHADLSTRLRRGLRALGLELLAADACASPTVTAVRAPVGSLASDLKRRLQAEHDIVVSVGMGQLKEQVLRIAHMGYCTPQDIDEVLQAFADLLRAPAERRKGSA
jgi:aspartate aminotransferase-like enzyme